MSSGSIVQIIGAVIDVEFPRDSVPKVYDALKVNGAEFETLSFAQSRPVLLVSGSLSSLAELQEFFLLKKWTIVMS